MVLDIIGVVITFLAVFVRAWFLAPHLVRDFTAWTSASCAGSPVR
jgi:hypothetical protein